MYKILVAVLPVFLSGYVKASQEITLAVHPFLAASEVINKFTPLAKYLSTQTHLSINVKVGSSYDEHIDYIGNDRVELAYMGPASYVTMIEKYGSKPVLATQEVNGQAYFQGNIIVHEESKIQELHDLVGKRIAFGDPNSTMSYIVPHYMLHKAGVFINKDEKHQFLHSHDNVALAVLAGEYDAGAVKPAVFGKFKKDGLRTIAMTPKISEHLFVASNKLNKNIVATIQAALLSAAHSADGMQALHAINKSITGMVVSSEADYANLRKIINESAGLH